MKHRETPRNFVGKNQPNHQPKPTHHIVMGELTDLASETCADVSAQIHKTMKLSDLIIARDRLEDEILQRPIIDSEDPIRELTNKLEPFTGAWHKHILKNPSDDQPFIDLLKPLCTEEIRKFPARAKCFEANQIKHAARVLRLATLNSLLQQVAHGAIDLEDETKTAGDTKPAFDKKPAPLSPVVRQ